MLSASAERSPEVRRVMARAEEASVCPGQRSQPPVTLLVTSVEYEDWLYVPGPDGDSEEITIQ